jgi:inosine triphosphate pyrophosphatase
MTPAARLAMWLVLAPCAAAWAVAPRAPGHGRHLSRAAALRASVKFVSSNAQKVAEITAQLGLDPLGGDVSLEMVDLDLEELQAATPEVVAIAKVETASRLLHRQPVIVEDTSLCFAALGGLPGPYIRWFMEAGGNPALVAMLDGFADKSAWCQCTIAYHSGLPGAAPLVFVGRTSGAITPEPAGGGGGGGFGWDAIFTPDGSARTFAEMTVDEKNACSHRGKALALLAAHLRSTAAELTGGGGGQQERVSFLEAKDEAARYLPSEGPRHAARVAEEEAAAAEA